MELSPSTLSDNQYRRALRSLRAAKSWFSGLLLLMLLIDLGAMVTVRFLPDITASPSLQAQLARGQRAGAPGELRKLWHPRGAASQPASQPVGAPAEMSDETPAADPPARALGRAAVTTPASMPTSMPSSAPTSRPAEARGEAAFTAISLALPFAMSMGLVCALIVVALQTLIVLTVLAGRIGDAGTMASALAWSLVLAALVTPWNLAFGPQFVPGVLFLRGELIEATAAVTWGAHPDWADLAWYCARFVGYPVVAVLVWLLVGLKSSAGVRQPSVSAD
jgi:hypothetical protein